MHERRIGKAGTERGGALIIVLLVVLVLTIVGIGVAYFTQLEDQSSGNIRLSKTAFYAAETGLRTGEVELSQANATGTAGSDLLRIAGTTIALPGGGAPGIPLFIDPASFDQVLIRAAQGTRDVSTFTLYIRNNVEDPGNAGPTPLDTDRTLNLISVGQVWASDGAGARTNPPRLLATKILEEQIRFGRPGESVAPQEGVNESGTNTGQIGRSNP
jgi:hypothetical protein